MKKLLTVLVCAAFITLSGCGNVTQEKAPLIKGEDYDYCYNNLNEHQKDLYNKILSGMYEMNKEQIYLTNDPTDISENINLAYGAVTVDHPEIFWLSGEYQILTLSGEKFYIKVQYSIDTAMRDGQAVTLQNRVDKIMQDTKEMTPPDKEKYFHDYLCDNVTFTNDGDSTRYTAFGALVNGKAVCEGYAKAMQLLCKTAGINCTLIKGVSNNESHMWNTVEIYDEWYEIDVTWDDLEQDNPIYRFYNLTTTQMQKTHTRYEEIKGLGSGVSLNGIKYNLNPPVCTAIEYAYKEKISKE